MTEIDNIDDMGRFIISLYYNSTKTKPEDFLPWVFLCLKKHIEFDKVFFATLDNSKFFLEDFPYFGEKFSILKNPKFIKIIKKNSNSNTYQQLLLFCENGFSERDRIIIRLIFPSIIASLKASILNFSPLPLKSEYALVDNDIDILTASKNFIKEVKALNSKVYTDFLTSILRGGNFLCNEKIIEIRPYLDVFIVSLRPMLKIDTLTPRQKEVAALLKQGYSYKEIAKELNISPSTVTNHINAIYSKLAINHSSQLHKLIES